MALAFKDTVEGCSIPLALQTASNTARESGGGRTRRLSQLCRGSCDHQGVLIFRGFYPSDWGDTWSQLGELTEGQCLSRLYPRHGLLPRKQG